MAAYDDDHKEGVEDGVFGSEEVGRSLLLGSRSRRLPAAAAHHAGAGAGAGAGEFSFAEDEATRAMKSVGATVVDAAVGPAEFMGASFNPGAVLVDDSAAGGWGPARVLPRYSKAVDIADSAAAYSPDETHPPMLPCPPYPLEAHTYSVSSKAGAVWDHINEVLADNDVDARAVQAECRWECYKGSQTSFHIRMYKAAACLAVEFQRRQGCSIAYNKVVVAIRSALEGAMECDLERFVRSGPDAVALPPVGFAVSFDDIPDVPFDLGMDFGMDSEYASAGGLLSDSEETTESEPAGVSAVIAMAESYSVEMQQEGYNSLAVLSESDDSRALLCAEEGLPKVIVAGLLSKDVKVAGAAATVLANLSADRTMQAALVKAGAVVPALNVAQRSHSARDAHLRRECLRAVANLTATQGEALRKAGGLKKLLAIAVRCTDKRMAEHADRAVAGLSA